MLRSCESDIDRHALWLFNDTCRIGGRDLSEEERIDFNSLFALHFPGHEVVSSAWVWWNLPKCHTVYNTGAAVLDQLLPAEEPSLALTSQTQIKVP